MHQRAELLRVRPVVVHDPSLEQVFLERLQVFLPVAHPERELLGGGEIGGRLVPGEESGI
jgi:hypothetical protein